MVTRLMVAMCLAFCLSGCSSTRVKPELSRQEREAWEAFFRNQSAIGSPKEPIGVVNRVVAIGDKIVPYVEDSLGKAYREKAGRGDDDLVIVLARIGTPRAIQGLVKVLEHNYPGAIGRDRMIAASALVRLGAKHAAPALREAIADHQRLARSGDGQRAAEIGHLRRCLGQLEQGIGKRDTENFPHD